MYQWAKAEREEAENSPDEKSAQAPNLVLITLDTLRADHLGFYGYERNTSPVLDALAAESAVFENCFSSVPTTLPAHLTSS